jgi:hypothetical protein
MKVAGEFAFVSTDADGLRLATLNGGTLLESPSVTLKPAARERKALITSVDYMDRTMKLDGAWGEPDLLANRVFEVGRPGRMTTYTVNKVSADRKATAVTVTGGADFYLSRIKSVDEEKRQVVCLLAMPGTTKEFTDPLPGIDKHWMASNDEITKFWRADALKPDINKPGEFVFQLDGPVTEADFGKTQGFRLWEYGTGDTARMSTIAGLRRIGAGLYELTADCDVTVGLKGSAIESSVDQNTWKPLKGKMSDGKFEAQVAGTDLLAGKGCLFLRVK